VPVWQAGEPGQDLEVPVPYQTGSIVNIKKIQMFKNGFVYG
jgi:hypothetical protein